MFILFLIKLYAQTNIAKRLKNHGKVTYKL